MEDGRALDSRRFLRTQAIAGFNSGSKETRCLGRKLYTLHHMSTEHLSFIFWKTITGSRIKTQKPITKPVNRKATWDWKVPMAKFHQRSQWSPVPACISLKSPKVISSKERCHLTWLRKNRGKKLRVIQMQNEERAAGKSLPILLHLQHKINWKIGDPHRHRTCRKIRVTQNRRQYAALTTAWLSVFSK